jgi:hypothetical protein
VAEIFERQVVLFIDLLGFSETSYQSNLKLQSNVLALLTSIASLKSDFVSSSTKTENGTTHNVRPSVSTFSDHIVASYSLSKIEADDDRTRSLIILSHLSGLVSAIGIAALSMGFLIRGGIATGNLFHSGGVVFGEALIEAVALESRTAVYHASCYPNKPHIYSTSPRALGCRKISMGFTALTTIVSAF